jgi:hypothetical protein
MATLTIEQESQELMLKEVNPIVQEATALVVQDQEESTHAQGILQEIKRRAKVIAERMERPVRAAYEAWKAVKELENGLLKPLAEAESIIKRKVIAFENVQSIKREEEQRRAQAKADEEARKEREKLEAQAKKAEEKGKSEKAEALRAQAEVVHAAPVFTPPAPAKVQGTAFKKVWRAEVTDLKALCGAVADGKAPLNLVSINPSAMNALARGVKNTMPVAGLRFFEDTDMAVRAR